MPNLKISQLAALTTPDVGDLLAIVDDPSGTPVTKKITLANLFNLPGVSPTFGAISATSVTDSGLTAGRVPFAGVGGLLSDAAGLTFDSTLTQLLTGGPLGSAFTSYFGTLARGLFVSANNAADDVQANIMAYTAGTDNGEPTHATGGFYGGAAAGGTRAVPTAIKTENYLVSLTGFGYQGSDFDYGGGLNIRAAQDWTPTHGGTDFHLYAQRNDGIGGNDIFLQFLGASGLIVGVADMLTTVQGSSITLSGDTVLANGKVLKSDTTTAHTYAFQVYDNNASAMRTWMLATNGDAPSVALTVPTTGTLTIAATSVKGTLQTNENASTGLVAGVLSALTNASIVITDGAGQVYRVPCVI